MKYKRWIGETFAVRSRNEDKQALICFRRDGSARSLHRPPRVKNRLFPSLSISTLLCCGLRRQQVCKPGKPLLKIWGVLDILDFSPAFFSPLLGAVTAAMNVARAISLQRCGGRDQFFLACLRFPSSAAVITHGFN